MNIRKIILVLCCAFSLNAVASDVSPILFNQVFPVKTNTPYEVGLENLQASDQVWTAVYLVGRQNYPGPTSKVDFVIENQGLLNKVKPTENTISQTLIAENLVQSNDYSFNQFKKLKKLLEQNGVNSIEDPVFKEGDEVRVYSQVNDWIPEYNSYEAPMVKFSVKKPVDFDIVAAYILVGKGPKPVALNELNSSALVTAQVVPVVATAVESAAASNVVAEQVVVTRQAQTSVEPSTSIKTSEHGASRPEVKFMILMLFGIVMAFFVFIHRKKLKQAF